MFKSLANKPISYSLLSLGTSSSPSLSPRKRNTLTSFEGQMQQLILNSRSYFELIANGDLLPSSGSPVSLLNRTASFLRPDVPHKYALTFRSRHSSWLALPKIDTLHLLMIQFHFKTSQANGLIMFNRGLYDDFIAIELVDGQVLFSFSLNMVCVTH